MMHLKNIRVQKARTPEQASLTKRFSISWLFDEDGNNWYEAQRKFSPDTLKIAYDDGGVIRRVDMDVSAINPDGFSVVELPATTANRRADVSGCWMFDGTSVIRMISDAPTSPPVAGGDMLTHE
ncbi:tail fiber assembly protein [Salmonella enterica subsp. enterica serovar Minnesota]|nr:tail fiber assembly protein [Salmonella enterica subsp. enterica serovar Minnesota]ECI4646693.1 tail fiber assembly protein [Salmonella enterica subsp. salamae]